MSKRKAYQHHNQRNDEIVDDLAFAATFAIMTSSAENTSTTISPHLASKDEAKDSTEESSSDDDNNEIEIDVDEEKVQIEDTNKVKEDEANMDGDHEPVNDDDDDDDESDVDLTKELMQMEQEDEDEWGGKGNKSKKSNAKSNRIVIPIKTQNEVDIYNCPIEDLKRLDIDIDLDFTTDTQTKNVGRVDNSMAGTTESAAVSDRMKQDNTKDASQKNGDLIIFQHSNNDLGIMNAVIPLNDMIHGGHIQNHLVKERTIVVASNTIQNRFLSNMTGTGTTSLLDEGSLLFVKMNDQTIMSKFDGTDGDTCDANIVSSLSIKRLSSNECYVIPLGKILEVFGPVSKPLYTIRLLKIETKNIVRQEVNKQDGDLDDNEKNVANTENGKQDMIPDNEKSSSTNEKEQNGDKEDVSNDNDNESKDRVKVDEKTLSNEDMHISSSAKNNIKQEEQLEAKTQYIDPWSENGLLTKWIKENPRLEVYYTKNQNQVKFLDTQSVVRNSRKGCDASNIYDEEVDAVKEMYFSDDEEERQFKQKAKGKRGIDNSERPITTGPRQGRGRGGGRGRGRGRDSYNHRSAHQYNSMSPPPPPPPPMWQHNQHQYQNTPPVPAHSNQYSTANNTFPPYNSMQHPQGNNNSGGYPTPQYSYGAPQYQHQQPPPPPPPPPGPPPGAMTQQQPHMQQYQHHCTPNYPVYQQHQHQQLHQPGFTTQNHNMLPSSQQPVGRVPLPYNQNPPPYMTAPATTQQPNQQQQDNSNDTVYYNYSG